MKAKLKPYLTRFNEWRKEHSFLMLAFIIPVIITWMIYIALEVFPFGNNSVLVLDLNGQYVNFFADLKNKLHEGGSFLYSWTRSMGGEYMGIFAYYVSSPFSFIVSLFSHSNITEALLLIILFKAGSMGATMSYYLNESYKTTPMNTLIFSTCYALSGYAVVMANNTMWFDCLIYLPLVTLGIERIIKRGDFKLFVVSLSMCLLTSFYIGYMVCIYVALYFFCYYLASSYRYGNNFWLEDNHFFKSFARIIIYSAIAIAISAIIILPAYTSLGFGKNTFSEPDFSWTQRFDWLDFVVKLLPGSYDTVRPEGLPFVYCGVIALLLLPIYFITSRINWRERMMNGVLLSIILFSFNINALDMVWHGFQKPNWLNYRYSFMFIFLILVCAYKAYSNLQHSNFKNVAITGGILVLLVAIIQKLNYKNVDNFTTVWFSIIAIGVFCVALYFVYRKKYTEMGTAVVLLLVCAELFGAGLMNAVALDDDVIMSSRDSYNNYYEAVQPMVDYVKKHDRSPFYRMEKNFHRQYNGRTNDSMTLNYYGISNSTSTLNKSIIDLLHRYGYASKSHWSQYLGGTPVSDALIGIKYVISNEQIDNKVWNEIHTMDVDKKYRNDIIGTPEKLYLYENPYALSLAFGSSDMMKYFEISNYESPMELMNAMAAAIMGSDEDISVFDALYLDDTIFTNIRTDFATNHRKYSARSTGTAKIDFKVEVKAGEPVYMYIPTDYPRECNLAVNGSHIGSYMGNKSDCVQYLGIFDEDQMITVTLTLTEDPIYVRNNQNYFFSLNTELFKTTFEEIAKSNLNITKFEEDYLEGTVTISEGQSLLYTSITFDEGWIIEVDGKRADLIKINDSQIAIEISEGTHKVTFTYRPKCYVYGSALSIIGLLSFAGAIAYDEIKKIRDKRKWAEQNNIF